MVSVFKKLLSSKIFTGTSLFAGSLFTYNFARDYSRVSTLLGEAQRISRTGEAHSVKFFILTDNSRSSWKKLRLYAEPIMKLASADYTVISTVNIDKRAVFEHIALNPRSRIVLAGDDAFINENVNYMYTDFPEYLKNSTLSVIPVGRINRFSDNLGFIGSPRAKIAHAALTCIKGSKTPIHPAIIQTGEHDYLILDSLRTGHLAEYDQQLLSNRFFLFGPLRYALYYGRASWTPKHLHTITYTIKELDETVYSDAFLVKNNPIFNGMKFSNLPRDSNYLSVSNFLHICQTPQNPVIMAENHLHRSTDHNYRLQLCGAKASADGKYLPETEDLIRFTQFKEPMFHCLTAYELLKSPTLLDRIGQFIPNNPVGSRCLY